MKLSAILEGLSKAQKKVGQLGPTEKVKKNSGARGKLVGACESFINTDVQAVVSEEEMEEDFVKNAKRFFTGKDARSRERQEFDKAHSAMMSRDTKNFTQRAKNWGRLSRVGKSPEEIQAEKEKSDSGNISGLGESSDLSVLLRNAGIEKG